MIHIMTFSKSLNVHLLLQKKPALFSEALKMPSDLVEPGRAAVPSTVSTVPVTLLCRRLLPYALTCLTHSPSLLFRAFLFLRSMITAEGDVHKESDP